MAISPLEKFKQSFAENFNHITLNNAGMAPLTKQAKDAVIYWTERFFHEGDAAFLEAAQTVEQTRIELGKFLGAQPEQIAFTASTAAAISQIAFGFPLKAGDEIVVWEQEYPSNFYPWMAAAERTGARLIVIPDDDSLETPAEKMLSRITDRTRILAFSWVQYRTGAIADLPTLTHEARRRDIFTCADVIQGAGILPFNFNESGLDAACGGTHKWLASPTGSGYLILRPDQIAKIRPTSVGAMSYGDFNSAATIGAQLKADASRFEPGAKCVLNLIAFGASLRLFNDVGIYAIATETERLAGLLVDGLRSNGYKVFSPHAKKHRGAIVTFGPTEDSPLKSLDLIQERLKQHQVAFAPRPPGIRLSPHAYMRESAIEKVLGVLS